MTNNSLVIFERGQNIVENRRGGRSAPTTVNSSVRTREYLTTAEIEQLMAAARKSSRYGHRDATMILIGYRHLAGVRVVRSAMVAGGAGFGPAPTLPVARPSRSSATGPIDNFPDGIFLH